MKKKSWITIAIVVVAGVFGYVGWNVYNNIAQSIIEKKIKEAGLNPADYDLRSVAPWNVRNFVESQEIKKAGFNPDNYDIKGTLTADEVRAEVTRQEIAKQLAEYDLSMSDIDLSGVDLLSLSAEEIKQLVTEKITEKIKARSF